MTTYATSRGLGLERAYQHWRERGALLGIPSVEDQGPSATIAISRESGAGGAEIARAVAARLEWPVYDRELVDKIAHDSGVRAPLLQTLDEKRPNWLAECVEGLSEEKTMSGAGFAVRLRKTLIALYCHGNCVILGRGAAQILPAERTLRIRLIAPRPWRVTKAAQHFESPANAGSQVDEIDRGRVDFVKSYFLKDPTDLLGYDLTVDVSRFSASDCSDFILAALAARQRLLRAQA